MDLLLSNPSLDLPYSLLSLDLLPSLLNLDRSLERDQLLLSLRLPSWASLRFLDGLEEEEEEAAAAAEECRWVLWEEEPRGLEEESRRWIWLLL